MSTRLLYKIVLYILYVKLKSSIFEFSEFSIGFFFQIEFRKLESYFSRLGDNDSEGKKNFTMPAVHSTITRNGLGVSLYLPFIKASFCIFPNTPKESKLSLHLCHISIHSQALAIIDDI